MSIGYLYVILFYDENIKVGRTMVPNNRLLAHSKNTISNHFISNKCSDLLNLESKLIAYALSVCGCAVKGRELFGGQMLCRNIFSVTPRDTKLGVNFIG